MTLEELRDIFRREVFDVVEPYLWSDVEVSEFANDAVMEAVRRGWTIIDSSTADICTIAYDALDPVVDLDPRIIVIRQAMVTGQVIPLQRMLTDRMNQTWPGWKDHTAAYPTMYVTDYGSNTIRLYPKPTAAGVLNLVVAREPLAAMVNFDEVPELPARYHRSLVEWMKFRAYQKNDTETQNEMLSAQAEARFAREFGERRSARSERWLEEQGGQMQDTLC